MLQNGEEKPSLIIFDLNNANAKPLTLIPKLKSKLKKGTSIIGFLSHVQGDLKQKAHEWAAIWFCPLGLLPEPAPVAAPARSPGRRESDRAVGTARAATEQHLN